MADEHGTEQVPQECIEQLQQEVMAGNEDLRLLQLSMLR
jgi:succinylglutamate desuccinylase